MSNVIDGKAVAAKMRAEQRERVRRYKERTERTPGLAVVLVGNDPASEVYVRNKQRACDEVGMYSEVIRLGAETPEDKVIETVERLNADDRFDGIIVQLPLPGGMDANRVTHAVAPQKDVDGLHPLNAGNLMHGADSLRACTPRAVMRLLDSTGEDLRGKHAVIVGRSALVGKPLTLMLLERDATVTICHSKTEDLPGVCRDADIVISAAGQPGLIGEEHVRRGAIVIDVGTTRVDGRVCGDVDFDSVADVAGWITPVPGGVGPMTVTMLLENTLETCGA